MPDTTPHVQLQQRRYRRWLTKVSPAGLFHGCRLKRWTRLNYRGDPLPHLTLPILDIFDLSRAEQPQKCFQYPYLLRSIPLSILQDGMKQPHLNSRCTLVDMTQLTWKGRIGLLMSDACSTALINSTRSSSFSSRNGPGRPRWHTSAYETLKAEGFTAPYMEGWKQSRQGP